MSSRSTLGSQQVFGVTSCGCRPAVASYNHQWPHQWWSALSL